MTQPETSAAQKPRTAGADFHGNLAGAQFRFRTTATDLGAYARVHLAALASDGREAPDVDVTLRWHEGQPPRERTVVGTDLAGMERVDRDLYMRPGELHWFRVDDLRDLHLRFRWQDQRLSVEGDFFYRVANDAQRDWAKRVLYRRRVAALRQRRFTTLLYYLVYYPCWWWLEQTRDLHPIHAGAAATSEGVILLAGASGVGKSSIALALATLPGGHLLSDSFVLHHETQVFPVREPVLLDAWSWNWLGKPSTELQAIDWRYGLDRHGYQVPRTRLADSGQAALLVLPRRAGECFTRRIPPVEAHQRLSAADLIINDLRRYWAFAAILEQMSPAGLVARRENHLAKLTAEVPCYEIGLTPEMTSATVAQSIVRLTREKPLRVVGSRPRRDR